MRALAMAALVFLSFAPPPTPTPLLGQTTTGPGQRIDAPLLERLREGGEEFPVFVLLATQPDLAVDSYRSRPDLDKQGWREEAIRLMRELAARSQSALLDALADAGHDASVERSLWIVNGLSLTVSADAIHWMSGSEHVARVYSRAVKPDDLIELEGRFTQAFEQPNPVPVTLEEVLAHDELSWNLERIQADLVWSRLGLLGRGVVLALLDSGVNYRHSDFRQHLWRNAGEIERNGIDDDGNGYVDDIYGFNFANGNSNIADDFFHGTSSASVMVGDGRGGMLTGVAPAAELMVLRVYDQMTRYNSTELWKAFQYDAWEAIQYAVEEGADVINMSVAWEPAEDPLHAVWRHACTNAVAAGVVMVAGAGNFRGSYPLPGQIRPPASIPAVIATGGTFQDDTVADLTSRGPVTWTTYPPFADYALPEGLDPVAFSAPWGYFPVTVFSGRGYQVLAEQRGSSLTSPHVAGVIALMLEANPELRPDEIRERLERTSADVGEIGRDPYTGAGVVQAYDAIVGDSLPRPRVTAVRYELDPASNAGPVPGSDVTVVIDLANSGRTDRGGRVTLRKSAPAAADAAALGSVELDELPGLTTLRFPVHVPDDAVAGSSIPLRLELRLHPGLRHEQDLDLPVWGSDLLVIDDDGGGYYERSWRDSLERQRIPYDFLSYWPTRRLPLPDLARYRTVVWLKGEESYETFSDDTRSLLSAYMSGGGRLVVAGQNVARDLAGSHLLALLGAAYEDDFQRLAGIVVRDPDGAALMTVPFTSYPTLPDRLSPTGQGWALLDDGAEPSPAVVGVGTANSALVSIEIEGVADPLHRDHLVRLLVGGGGTDR